MSAVSAGVIEGDVYIQLKIESWVFTAQTHAEIRKTFERECEEAWRNHVEPRIHGGRK